MSIKVSALSKVYEEQKAVNNISFEINQGEIVGFLGPNGAGKSTTMKMITNFIEPTSGSVEVCGLDVIKNPQDIRSKIGYLPEHNPLYLDMYVEEYLSFVADLNKVDSKKERINEMIALTGLEKERKKKIEQLSKGYRQRVGLASALIHDPEVIILDEPTTGLDPNQIVEIRKLIQEIAVNKTILLSSHIMQEVQALCSRIIIIKNGEIIANDSIEKIQSKAQGSFSIELEIEGNFDIEALKTKAPSITSISKNDTFHIASKSDCRKEIFQFCVDTNCTILTMKMEQENLENVFQSLTKN